MRTFRLLTLAAGTLAGLYALAKPPDGAARERPVLKAYWPLVADGVRYAAYKPDPTTLVILDTRRHSSRKLTVGANCTPDAATVGTFLVNCFVSADTRPFTVRAGGGGLQEVPGRGSTWQLGQDKFLTIGREWLRGTRGTAHQITLYVNWHTGEARPVPEEQLEGPFTPFDVDSPRLQPLGPPISDSLFAVSSPYVVRRDGKRLRVEKRGRRLVQLATCKSFCGSPSLGAGLVSWSQGRTA